jgi:AhpC/TSA family
MMVVSRKILYHRNGPGAEEAKAVETSSPAVSSRARVTLIGVTRWGALAGVLLAVAASVPGAVGSADPIEDLLFELQLVPLDGAPPAPFTLETVEGRRVSLTDFRGKVVLLYFWATW